MYEHSNVITSNDVKDLLRSRYFFDDVQLISTILKPIKEAVTFLEAKNTTLADCFLQICKIGATIKKLPDNNQEFKRYCIDIFNKRWNDFSKFEGFILCYFLHPKYRGK
jgi:hypothetical protein